MKEMVEGKKSLNGSSKKMEIKKSSANEPSKLAKDAPKAAEGKASKAKTKGSKLTQKKLAEKSKKMDKKVK